MRLARKVTMLLALTLLAVGAPSVSAPLYSQGGTSQKKAKKAESAVKDSMKTEAKIGRKEAEAIALKEVPRGKVKVHSLDRVNGQLVRTFDITVKGKPGVEEVVVDAMTGKVLKHEHVSSVVDAKERRADRKAADEAPKAGATKKP